VEISGDFDLVLIATPHDEYKNVDFAALGVPVVDTRNVVREKGKFLYRA
jgi:UDP-N-acetyl-D-mannosaminuronate dehydrogenase